jgi:hypothetical protein
MERRPVRISLVIMICLFLSLSSVYLHCCNLAGANLFSADLSFESPDEEDLLAGQQNESKVFVSSVFPTVFVLGANLLEELFPFSFLTPSPDQKTLILLC